MNALKATVTMTFATVLLAAVLVAPFGAQVADGAITAYVPFDTDKNDTTGSMPFFFDVGAGQTINPTAGLFGGAMVSPAANSSSNWCGNAVCKFNDNTLTKAQGTIEFFVSPTWAGTSQGGPGVGGSGVGQHFIHQGGSLVNSTTGLNFGIFNNNYPNDGGQLFASVKDTDGNAKILESNYHPSSGHTNGSTKDWAAGSWHHVAFTWDASNYTTWLDGDRIAQVAAGTGIAWGADIWLGGTYNAGSLSWDGMIDDFVIRDNVQYDPSQATYDVPTRVGTFVAPEPATLSMLGIGGLGLLRRRR